MPMRPERSLVAAALAALLALPAVAGSHDKPGQLGLGHAPSKALIAAWNIDVSPAGDNLPPGNGSVAQGREIFANTCAGCHGAEGGGKPMDRLVGGKGTLDNQKPVKTVGSYWPYPATLYDYIHRAMPFSDPGSLAPDQVYALVAYLLNLNGILPDDAVMDATTLRKVTMPNRGSFEQTDTVTLAKTTECMKDCKPLVGGR